MASSLELDDPHQTPSFSLRDDNNNNNTLIFPRSSSTKEPHISDAVCLPPRLSAATVSSLHLHHPLSFTPDHSTSKPDSSYRCVSSVLKKDGQILAVAAADGALVYTGSQSNVVRVWKLPEFAECGQLKTKACMVVALHVSNDRVYAAYADCRIRVWRRTWEGVVKHVRVATVPMAGSIVRSYIAGRDRTVKHLGPISSLAINTADDLLYSASLDKTVKVWRISDYKCVETIPAHSDPINALALSPSDGVLYTASDDATVRVWRRSFTSSSSRITHSLTVTLPTKHSPVKTLTLTHDGAVLYGGCTDGYVHYWMKGWLSGQLQHGGALPGHTHAVMCMASVGGYVVSGSADSTARVWVREVDGFHTCVAVLQGHRGPIRCVAAFGSNRVGAGEEGGGGGEEGCTLCTGSLDGVIKVWRVRNTAVVSQSRDQATTLNAREYFELT